MSTLLQDNPWWSGQAGTNCGQGYQIRNSLRFRGLQPSAGLQADLNPTNVPNNAGACSCWVKLGNLDENRRQAICSFTSLDPAEGLYSNIEWNYDGGGTTFPAANNRFSCFSKNNNLDNVILTEGTVTDPSAWYHLYWAKDLSGNFYFYVNGVDQSSNTSGGAPIGWNYWDSYSRIYIGNYSQTVPFEGYIAEFYFVQNSYVPVEAFGQFDGNGVWVPKNPTSTIAVNGFGQNGFYLKFDDPNNPGKDSSGLGNDLTLATGFQLTTPELPDFDWMQDSPTRNHAVLNPLWPYTGVNNDVWYLDRCHMGYTMEGRSAMAASTFIVPDTGKYYFEHYNGDAFTNTSGTASGSDNKQWGIGYGIESPVITDGECPPFQVGYTNSNWNGGAEGASTVHQQRWYDGILQNSPTSFNTGLVSTSNMAMQSIFDSDAMRVYMGLENQAWQLPNGTASTFFQSNSPTYDGSPTVRPMLGKTIILEGITSGQQNQGFQSRGDVNFGQYQFRHDSPLAGVSGLHTSNLPLPAIPDGSEHCEVIVGAGASILADCQAKFPNGLYMIKDLTATETNGWQLVNPLMGQSGNTGCLHISPIVHLPNPVDTPYVAPTNNSMAICWGFPTGSSTTAPAGQNGATLASEYIVNELAGFSTVRVQNATSGYHSFNHGLGTAPNVAWFFQEDDNGDPGNPTQTWWGRADQFPYVDDSIFPPIGDGNLWLPFGSGDQGNRQIFEDAAGDPVYPDENLVYFQAGGGGAFDPGDPMIAFFWSEVPGYSKFGYYVANNSTDGPFINCGFTPKIVIIKAYGLGEYTPWSTFDTVRGPINPNQAKIHLSGNTGEIYGESSIDFHANGFKIRSTDFDINNYGFEGGVRGDHNYSYMYMAFADVPFGGQCVAPATAR